MPSPGKKIHNGLFDAMRTMVSTRRTFMARGVFSLIAANAAAIFSILLVFDRVLAAWRYRAFFSYIFFWASLSAAIVYAAAWLWANSESTNSLAEHLGKESGNGNLFSAAMEFSKGGKRLGSYSGFLMKETVRRAVQRLGRISPPEAFGGYGRPGWMVAGLITTLVLLIQVTVAGGDAGNVIRAISDPGISFRKNRGNNLLARGSGRSILAGEDVAAEAVRMGSSRGEVRIYYSSVPGLWKSETVQADTSRPYGLKYEAFNGAGIFRHTFHDVREDLSYYFEAGGERTKACSIRVIHRPVINHTGAVLVYPSYTGVSPDTVRTLSGRIAALAGTKVELSGETSKAIRMATASFATGETISLQPVSGGFRGEFEIVRDDTLMISVADSMGLKSDSSVRYPIFCRDDRAPSIGILSPRDEAILPRSLRVELTYRAVDDFGIAAIDLRYMKEGRDEVFGKQRLFEGGKRVIRVIEETYGWSLEGMRVFPGDRIIYYMEIRDNNTSDGPGYSRTDMRVLVMPSLAELYAEARKEEQHRNVDMKEILEESDRIRDRLKELSDDFKAEGGMDWDRKKEGKEILEIQKRLKEKIGEAADRLDRTLRNLEDNRMTSMEIGRKMEEIQRLLQQIESEDLQRAMEKFKELMESMPENEMAAAMDEIEMRAEELDERLDRTIELLNRILREEKMEELVLRMEEMLEQQRALRDSTETGDLDEMAPRQKDLGEEFEDFDNDVEEFAGEENKRNPSSEMEELVDNINESDIDSLMRQAASEMESKEREQARETENETINRMLSLYTRLGRCQIAMTLEMDSEAMELAEKAAWELVETSKLHEKIVPGLGSRDASSNLESLLEDQLVIREAVRKIFEDLLRAARMKVGISNDTFMHLGNALQKIETVIDAMENRGFPSAAIVARSVTRELNMAVVSLLRSSSSSGNKGGNSREKMNTMLQKQSSIDEQLKSMFPQRGDNDSMEARARMARIAAEQRTMRELLEQIARESSGTGELLGKLDDIGSDMKEITERLERGELDESLIRKEERILSRLLESQRSLNRRDYKRERVSRVAGDIDALDAGIDGDREKDLEVLLEKIRRAMQEKGPAEYEELIKAYFRALSGNVRKKERE